MLADSVRCWQTAKEAYRRDSVLGSDEKDIVGSDHFQIIGAEVNSSKRNLSNGVCSVGAPTPKRLALISLTLKAAALPVMSRALASRLTGIWTSVLMFRRCLTCVLDKIYSFGVGDASEADEVLLLPRYVAQELVLASVLGLVAVSNVAVDYLPTIFATDASMSKGAVCSREVSPEVAELVWLGGDKRGCYTKLDPPFRALRRALGDFDEEEGIIHEDLPSSAIQKPLEFVFDFVEVCGGSGVVSSAMAKLGHIVCTPIDLDRSSHFDLQNCMLVHWILHMVRTRRFKSVMLSPPCTTFSAAAHPCVRSYRQPFGFNPSLPKTKLGNTLALKCLLILWVAAIVFCPALLEQPRLSKMCWLIMWKRLLARGLTEAIIASCQFGSPRRKEFRVIGCGLDMKSLEKRCPGGHKHIPIAGALTKPSAVYVPALASHFAKAFSTALRQLDAAEQSMPKVEGLESVVANDLLISGSWSVDLDWFWKAPGHINILESHSFLALLRRQILNRCDVRLTALLDSRVAKGAHAKGRSSADGMKPSLRKSAALQIVGGLYPSFGFAPTRLNTADDPTRLSDLRPPSLHSICDLLPASTLKSLHATSYTRFVAGWLRLSILLLCLRSTEAHTDAGPAFGFCHSLIVGSADGFRWICPFSAFGFAYGLRWIFPILLAVLLIAVGLNVSLTPKSFKPSGQFSHGNRSHCPPLLFILVCCHVCAGARTGEADADRAARRASVQLTADRAVLPRTRSSREKLLQVFEEWLIENWRVTLSDLVDVRQVDVELVSEALVAYGKSLFYAGKPYGRFSETINAISARRPLVRRGLASAWDLAFAWLMDEPSSHHPAMPVSLVLALAALSLLWGWIDEAAVILLTWSGILRIGEVLQAVRADLILPSDACPGVYHMLLKIGQPKTRGRSAKHQVARVDAEDVIRLVSAAFRDLPASRRLWRWSPSTLRRRFNQLQKALGLDTERVRDFSPYDLGSLRAGGATFLLQQCEDIELVRRRGRWLSSRVVEIYIQEAAVATYTRQLSDESKEKISNLASAFPSILEQAEVFTRQHLPPTSWRFLWRTQAGDGGVGSSGS